MRFPLDDSPQCDISASFAPAYDAIAGALDAGRRVLVHCEMGRSRSAAILTAFLMRRFDWTKEAAQARFASQGWEVSGTFDWALAQYDRRRRTPGARRARITRSMV